MEDVVVTTTQEEDNVNSEVRSVEVEDENNVHVVNPQVNPNNVHLSEQTRATP